MTDDYRRGVAAGVAAGYELAAQLCDSLWSRYADPAARAALGLVADTLREHAAQVRAGRP